MFTFINIFFCFRISTSSNPDVLGSIFSGIDTLHSDSLSVDNSGRLRIEESKTARNESVKKPHVPKASVHTTSTSNQEATTLSSSGKYKLFCSEACRLELFIGEETEVVYVFEYVYINAGREMSGNLNSKYLKF